MSTWQRFDNNRLFDYSLQIDETGSGQVKGAFMREKKVILYINTCDNKITTIDLTIDSKKYTTKESRLISSQTVLPLIDSIVCENNLKLGDITAIEVNTGPGSFTGLRVGIAIANVLGYLLDIPVNRKKGIPIEPKYL